MGLGESTSRTRQSARMQAPLGHGRMRRRRPQRRQARRPPPPRPRPACLLAAAAAPASAVARIHSRAAAAATGSPHRRGQQCPRQRRCCLGQAHRKPFQGVLRHNGHSQTAGVVIAPAFCFISSHATAQQHARLSRVHARKLVGSTQVWPTAAARAASSTAWLGRSSTPCSCASAPPALSLKPPRPPC